MPRFANSCQWLSFVIGLSFISIVTFGQSAAVQRPEQLGDQYFLAEQYFRAGQYYQRALQYDSSNYELILKLAHCERYQFNYKDAASWYQQAQRISREFSPEAAYYQSLMLKNLGQCERAYRWLDSLLTATEPQAYEFRLEAEKLKISCQEASLTSGEVKTIDVFRLDSTVNSENYDYAPVVMPGDSTLILTSTRFAGKQKISYRFGENNANLFSYRMREGRFDKVDTFTSSINSKASEGAGCYVASRQEFFFTYCANNQPCKIQFVHLEDGDWSSPESLPSTINLGKSESKHPNVSASGDTLFFASDRSGGPEGLNIWMSIRAGENQWLPPVCLDSLVNSDYDEVTPHYHSGENQLYFASDNPRGFGGMDLYVITDFLALPNRTRMHLPRPVNSVADDSYLALGKQLGYLASNRDGDFDIYRFGKKNNQLWSEYLMGISPIVDEKITATPVYTIRRTGHLDSEIDDWVWVNSAQQKRLSSGATRFILNSDVNEIQMREYQQRKKENQESTQRLAAVSTVISPDIDSTFILTTFSTDSSEREQGSTVAGIVELGATQQPFAEQAIELRGSDGQLLKTSTTNATGEFRFVNLPPNDTFSIALAPIEVEDTIQLRELSLKIEPEYIFSQVFEPIYFNFNQHELRAEATKVLENLAEFYQLNPEISVEINAFTDSLGNDVYNLLLSKKRGEAAFDYLIEAGVDRSALAINANGVSTAYTSTNAYVSQQLNRRVEFEIFGLTNPLEKEVATRILRPSIDLAQLLEGTRMTWEELSTLNGRPLDQLEPYKPIRVYKDKIANGNALFYQIIDIN
ncbi:MAG: OmpA family protein [Bacteroidota bacterium]